MRRFSDRHPLTTLSELNVTPLLDLAFVLLIIFMITTPLMENSVDLVVPTGEAKNPLNPGTVQTVAIDREERLQFNGEPTTREQVASLLTALRESNPDTAVVIRAHKELPVQKLIELIDVVKRAQIGRIGVVTTPDQP